VSLVQLLTTVGSKEEALDLAHAAVKARVAACVQVLGPITSVYRWHGEIDEAEEYLCLMKAPAETLERLAGFVRERHPYDTPEITTMGSEFVDDRYLAWAIAETSSPDDVAP
jgi:periplasmic divalent cation tolerance protein